MEKRKPELYVVTGKTSLHVRDFGERLYMSKNPHWCKHSIYPENHKSVFELADELKRLIAESFENGTDLIITTLSPIVPDMINSFMLKRISVDEPYYETCHVYDVLSDNASRDRSFNFKDGILHLTAQKDLEVFYHAYHDLMAERKAQIMERITTPRSSLKPTDIPD
ncbi:hypothetical protein [Vibrio phage BONAISHI]|nr:hypothetical protein [Vibrio phage BONAISHI]